MSKVYVGVNGLRGARAFGGALLFGCAAGLACAAVVPKELHDARDAYSTAAEGPAAQRSLEQLREAQLALSLAEQTFRDEGDTRLTRERARAAMRKAQLAAAQTGDDVATKGPAETPSAMPSLAPEGVRSGASRR